eukprot:1396478-Amphidinium_carterae.1
MHMGPMLFACGWACLRSFVFVLDYTHLGFVLLAHSTTQSEFAISTCGAVKFGVSSFVSEFLPSGSLLPSQSFAYPGFVLLAPDSAHGGPAPSSRLSG